jgi:hypothetical protein
MGWQSITVHSMLLDIDVAIDVFRMIEGKYLSDLKAAKQVAASASAAQMQTANEQLAATEGAKPGIILSSIVRPGASVHTPELSHEVAVDRLEDLGRYDRTRISMYGAGVIVEFHRWVKPMIMADPTRVGAAELAQSIANLIEKEGRPRPRWRPLSRFLPTLFALALTVVAIWVVAAECPEVGLVVFGALLLLAAWVGAVLTYKPIDRRYADWWPGHRFRESSRAAFRDRITNGRAAFVLTVIEVPLTVGGTLLVLWLSGLLHLK